jgi:valyl-tRNA synthetase
VVLDSLFSTLGWPNQSDDLKNFFPGQMLETGGYFIFYFFHDQVANSKPPSTERFHQNTGTLACL